MRRDFLRKKRLGGVDDTEKKKDGGYLLDEWYHSLSNKSVVGRWVCSMNALGPHSIGKRLSWTRTFHEKRGKPSTDTVFAITDKKKLYLEGAMSNDTWTKIGLSGSQKRRDFTIFFLESRPIYLLIGGVKTLRQPDRIAHKTTRILSTSVLGP